jgi:RNA polymerase-binding transcription factor DksA
MRRLLALLWGCRHRRTTWPHRREGLSRLRGGDYVVCLSCGREFEYDWRAMRRGMEIPRQAAGGA